MISSAEKPSAVSRSKAGSSSCASVKPSALQKSVPSVHRLKHELDVEGATQAGFDLGDRRVPTGPSASVSWLTPGACFSVPWPTA
jgi:hypothetical protein